MMNPKLGIDFQDQIYYDLNTVNLEVKEKQYLGDVIKEIPTNTILSKTLPGLGATTLEIKSKRHSIIIEPNVPVIKGKEKKHKEVLFGVYEGVTTDNVIDYLLQPLKKGKFKKLMTTPESFFKVIRAMNALQIDYYKDYMLLFDECDKIIKDISYRSTIAFPIEDFFLFENKAFVSATPILPSDSRFQNQNFEVIKIKPLFDYKRKMQLVTTNNVVSVFRKLLEMSNNDKPLCIFLNSTDTIYSIIDKFELKEQSQVFCSKDSVDKLKQLDGCINAYSNLTLDKKGHTKLFQYNFFTSRFFSAVDIDLEIQPIVVIISDLFYAKHSMIDPETESIQIIGRFRNGVNSIIHLSNTNSKLTSKTPEQLTSYLDGCHEIYIQLKTLFRSATEEGIRDTLKEALERVTYSQYIDKNGNRNHFAIDNYFDEEKVKGYYIHPSRLLAAYKDSPMFTVSYQHIDEPLGDNDRLKITRAENKRERRLIIIEQLNLLNGENGAYDEPLFKEFRDSLYKQDALIVEIYEELGEEFAVKNITSDKTMRLALIKYRSEQGLDKFAIMSSIYAVFSEGKKYTVSYIRKEIRNIYSSYGDSTEYQATKVKEFFQVDDKIWLNRKRAYFLIKKLY
ncbi:MAG: hypothetical protein ACLTWE_07835 [Dysgonomonas mossii]|uniref:hypothetical protein n=1 Tax=Dysgonomonas mossii TaxID=163665 RepID=UPI0039926B1F